MAGKIQKQDVKTEAELTGAGATAADLINDTQIYVSSGGINKTLDDAITDGDTVSNGAVTNAKLADMATQTIKGRTTAGTGDPEDLSATQATAILSPMVGDSGSGGTKGLVPAPAAGDAAAQKYLMADGSWSIPAGGSAATIQSQVFNSSGTFNVPAGVSKILIQIMSGGGGGGGARGSSGSGGGGGGGCAPVTHAATVTPSSALTVTVGAGGTAGAANGGTGGTGGTSSVTGAGILNPITLLGPTGGVGGIQQNVDGTSTSDGGTRNLAGGFYSSGGSATIQRATVFSTSITSSSTAGEGSVYANGGAAGVVSNNDFGVGGGGGAGLLAGGNGGVNGAGSAGAANGGAGGGGGTNATAGGAGGSGKVVIYWVA